jgi:hypothetical protein
MRMPKRHLPDELIEKCLPLLEGYTGSTPSVQSEQVGQLCGPQRYQWTTPILEPLGPLAPNTLLVSSAPEPF